MPNAEGYPKVQGRCPSCGMESLFLGENGYVTCGLLGCTDPCAASANIAYGRVDQVTALMRANVDTIPQRGGGSLRGAPSHSGAALVTAWEELGLRLVRFAPAFRASQDTGEGDR